MKERDLTCQRNCDVLMRECRHRFYARVPLYFCK